MDLHAYGAITSVLVERAGDLVHEQYTEGDASTLRNTRSCTKTVLSLLVGIAIERQVIDLDTVVGGRATVRELLTMSSPLACDDWDASSPGNEELMYPRRDWVGFARGLPERASRGFSYCTAGVVMLGAELERLLGEPLTAFAERVLFAPLGIERYEWPTTPLGETSCAGGLCLRSRDLLALGRLALPAAAGPVPGSWLDESTRPHVRVDDQTQYGYLWWLRTIGGRRSVYLSGMGGNRVHAFPEVETVVVVTSTNFGVPDAHALSDALVASLVA